MADEARNLLQSLSTEEKVRLTSGEDFWNTSALKHLDIPAIMMTDGPHGLRKQAGAADHLGLAASVPATCFPPATALASSFDPSLAQKMGEALGIESANENVAVILGPGINIKRSPLCGRNFEYMSEDPLVSGIMGTGLVQGIQSKGVGASLKHFAANNQETDRMRISADIDERPLREIYLRAFERVVKLSQPWTVMCSYNRINGTYTAEDYWLLTEVLRNEWGFNGLVVSDWGAVNNRVAAIAAGLDLEMPGTGGLTDPPVITAVENGELSTEALNNAAYRVLQLVEKAQDRPAAPESLDIEAHHAIAREVATRSIVLLKNDDSLLPLKGDASIALIGEFARTPRFQGGGSSHINPTKVDTVVESMTAALGNTVTFAPGFSFTNSNEDPLLKDEAVKLAAEKDIAVVCLGLTENEESEGFDRTHINLPHNQLELLDAVLAVNPHTVVVLSNGAVVALPFADRVPAILETWLLGQAGGSAITDILLGNANPSGHLAETIPVRLEDTPAYGNFPGEFNHVRYGEGIFVGYRWYDKRDLSVTYPFGHGLSYTTFSYGEPAISTADNGDLTLKIPVSNTGQRTGREVIQAYIEVPNSSVERAPRELKAFQSVEIPAGTTTEVTLQIRREDLAYWNISVHRFVVEDGAYRIHIGSSSRDIRATINVEIAGDVLHTPLSENSTIIETLNDPVVGPTLKEKFLADDNKNNDLLNFVGSIPIGRLPHFPGTGVSSEDIHKLIELANKERS